MEEKKILYMLKKSHKKIIKLYKKRIMGENY